ncbi:MAG: hypothetical protein ABSF90_26675 [Syntrophobacteraceae bacterium]|jgi:hypothetical protein
MPTEKESHDLMVRYKDEIKRCKELTVKSKEAVTIPVDDDAPIDEYIQRKNQERGGEECFAALLERFEKIKRPIYKEMGYPDVVLQSIEDEIRREQSNSLGSLS